MAHAAAAWAVIGVDSANRRQLLFSAVDREFLIARKSDCTVPGNGVTSPSTNFYFFGNGGITCRQSSARLLSVRLIRFASCINLCNHHPTQTQSLPTTQSCPAPAEAARVPTSVTED